MLIGILPAVGASSVDAGRSGSPRPLAANIRRRVEFGGAYDKALSQGIEVSASEPRGLAEEKAPEPAATSSGGGTKVFSQSGASFFYGKARDH